MILLTGGTGRLGRELRQLIDCHAPTRQELDITEYDPRVPRETRLIVHSAAYTDVAGAETNRAECFDTNVTATAALSRWPMVYISTEYVFDGERGDYREDDEPSPVNYYARTKLMGEQQAMRAPRWLILRCLFKPRPFQHEGACVDQYTSGDYVDVIARQVAQCVKWFDEGKVEGILHLGTGRKSTYELARQTREVRPISVNDVSVRLPRDTSLNTERFRELAKAHGY